MPRFTKAEPGLKNTVIYTDENGDLRNRPNQTAFDNLEAMG